MEELISNLTPSLKKYFLSITLGIIGVISLGYGLISSSSLIPKKEEIQFIQNKENSEAVKSASASAIDSESIKVDIAGAVINPGVYSLSNEARLEDALKIAGGLSDMADSEFVAKQFNLAAKLRDGAKVYIPRVNEGIGSTAVNNTVSKENTLININEAGLSELDILTGIGPVTAQKIIDNRPYERIEDILEKKVVSSSVFEKIKDKITCY